MSHNLHLVVGSGPIGSAVVRQLVDSGEQVRVATRSGSGLQHDLVERVAVDAADASRMASLAQGAAVIYNCVNPEYTRWATDWPPVAASLLAAAESSGAVLSTCSNVYAYGRVSGPMTEDLPLAATGTKGKVRAQMWRDALASHEAGRARVTEARGSDYIGPDAESHLGPRVMPKLMAGKKVAVLGSADKQHTWTFTEDMAATLIAIGSDERAWGRAWHVPSALTCTQREALTRIAERAGAPTARVGTVSPVMIRALGLVVPIMRELPEVAYQVEETFILDSSAAQRELGLRATDADLVLQAHADYYAVQARAAA
jgi:nucleoside-diphosphate-sugar epimerase